MEEQPLVTCLCLTTFGRRKFLEGAVDSYSRQTYPNRELLIVADSWMNIPEHWGEPDEALESIVAGVGSGMSSVILTPKRPAIGAKRNLGCESAAGDLIAIWDDDDYSAPDRLEFQVQSLQVSQKAVTGFQVCKFTDGASWWQYSAGMGFVVGSSLMFRRDWWDAQHSNPKFPNARPHHFPEIQIGEDAQFCEVAYKEGHLAMCPDMDLMYCSIHPGNTSGREMGKGRGWVELPGYSWPGSIAAAPG